MKFHCVRSTRGVLFLGLTLLFFSGCGYKNSPIPPESVVPAPIRDLLYQTDDKGVQLTWSYPVKTIRGSVLDDISSFELYRAEIPIEEYCPGCPIPFGEPLELPGGPPVDGKVRRKASYESSLLRTGYKYFFKVRSRTSWWADSADSNIVTFAWYQPAAAPEGVTAAPGDRQVALRWNPVTTLKDGSTVDMAMKYQVLRSAGGGGFERLGGPLPATEYIDRQVKNGVKYLYTVQSMMVIKDDLVSGGISEQVAATPLDITPPGIPTGVTVVSTDVGNKIFWDKSNAADIGGYRVFRRVADKNNFTLLGKVDPEFTIFVDRTAVGGVRYSYAVTAFDRATPPNESKKSRAATVRY